jgi:hypothetical protein
MCTRRHRRRRQRRNFERNGNQKFIILHKNNGATAKHLGLLKN